MNIFALSLNVILCAIYHHDKHVVKMILEYAQILSTCHHVMDPENANPKLYKKIHVNHPCCIWVRESVENYKWLYSLFKELCKEYTFRYNKVHKTETRLLDTLERVPNGLPDIKMTPFRQCMPVYLHRKNTFKGSIKAYRDYYAFEKRFFKIKALGKYKNKWSKREIPSFFTKRICKYELNFRL